MKKRYMVQIWLNAAMLLFFIALFIVGTFCDETVEAALYSPGNIVAKVITCTGVYPFSAAPALFIGALFERTLRSQKSKGVKTALCIVCIAAGLFMGLVGGGIITDRNCLGYFFPDFHRNIPVMAVVSVILIYPLFFVGYRFAKKSDDKYLSQRIIGLLILMIIAFAAMELLKGFFSRPRYRTAVLGYEGIGFVPWYTRFSGASDLMEQYGLIADEFRSFPSGHSIQSVSAVYILPALSWLFPKLKDKQLALSIAGLVFGILIMFTRIVLGAHYLSDVSAGAIIGSLLSLAFTTVQIRISAKSSREAA
ncbi:MAG: phosphatase PAP2 family protein [Ruminiclostridium sp.]|nr:phosphatase PAP2 family protein [Ruminiclostridium sp.]